MKLWVVKIVATVLLLVSMCNANQLEFWIMSQCPYCAQAEKSLLVALQKLPNEDRPDIEFNYVMIYDTLSSKFVTLHGEDEATENMRQMVIQHYYPNQFFDYILSKSSHYDDTLWIKDCYFAGLNPHTVDSLFFISGKNLGLQASKRVLETGISSTPSIFYNSHKIYNWSYDVPTIFRFLENQHQNISENVQECIDNSDCKLLEEVSKYRCSEGICIE